MALLEVTDLTAGYGDTTIIEGINIRVEAGAITAIVGPNGCGKSTLLKSILRLAHRFRGRIVFQDQEISTLPTYEIIRRGIAYVPQVNNVFSNLTVQENLEMGAYFRKDKEGIATDYEEIYTRFPELARRRRARAETLSGGERQLLAIGRALMGRPAALLLDEPLAFLAPKTAALILERLQAIKTKGVGILLVEQNTFLALGAAAYGYVLNQGRCVMEGTGAALLSDPALRERFLGVAKGV
ncbi:ABC transporter ATP-binding protein [Thermodesulfitimonas autotrophica]|uniref:ABC transporter ATP-binding protein n=1 Tax=Thermodesulfitimonas autotrophica TaxID=1894989 RepID=UPI002FE3D77D